MPATPATRRSMSWHAPTRMIAVRRFVKDTCHWRVGSHCWPPSIRKAPMFRRMPGCCLTAQSARRSITSAGAKAARRPFLANPRNRLPTCWSNRKVIRPPNRLRNPPKHWRSRNRHGRSRPRRPPMHPANRLPSCWSGRIVSPRTTMRPPLRRMMTSRRQRFCSIPPTA